jgi:type I restriction enzyme R subunit
MHLKMFQDNEKTIPTILTTSQKLSTGVDARNVRNIVLLRPVNSIIEFKQIIGRGTRLFDGKDYFTIYDFVKAYEHFSDPEWDGEPLEPTPPVVAGPRGPGDPPAPKPPPDDDPPRPTRLKIKLADGKERTIQHISTTTFWGPDGRPMSATQFVEALFGQLPQLFRDEAELRTIWGKPDTRRMLLSALAERGFGARELAAMSQVVDAEKSDVFDVLAYVAFAMVPITRVARVATRRSGILERYSPELRAFIDFVLGQYVSQGIDELDQGKLSDLLVLKYQTMHDAMETLGAAPGIRDAFIGFQPRLFDAPVS